MRGARDPAALVLSMRDGAAAMEMPCEGSAKNQAEAPRELAVYALFFPSWERPRTAPNTIIGMGHLDSET